MVGLALPAKEAGLKALLVTLPAVVGYARRMAPDINAAGFFLGSEGGVLRLKAPRSSKKSRRTCHAVAKEP
jgi:hypothetical protein